MAVQTKTTLKSYFETGDRPTQAEFGDLIDTLATLDGAETLTNKTIDGSDNTLSNIDLATSVTGELPVANGGTGAATAGNARSNLGLGTAAVEDASAFATAAQGALADTAVQPADFPAGSGLGSEGSITLPNGTILKYGTFTTGTVGNNASGTHNFPVAFPNDCHWALIGTVSGDASGNAVGEGFALQSFSASGIGWFSGWQARADANGIISYMALGY